MSASMDQLQPPPMDMIQHSIHGSVGPVIGVLALVTILGIIAGVIGRLCSGCPFMGHGQYDVEEWAERKCSSCIDGRLDPPVEMRFRWPCRWRLHRRQRKKREKLGESIHM